MKKPEHETEASKEIVFQKKLIFDSRVIVQPLLHKFVSALFPILRLRCAGSYWNSKDMWHFRNVFYAVTFFRGLHRIPASSRRSPAAFFLGWSQVTKRSKRSYFFTVFSWYSETLYLNCILSLVTNRAILCIWKHKNMFTFGPSLVVGARATFIQMSRDMITN